MTDEELDVLMPWSEEYKAYEKREIEAWFDAITLGYNIPKPTKASFMELRRQMEEEDSANEESHDDLEKSELNPVGQPDAAVEDGLNLSVTNHTFPNENEPVKKTASNDDSASDKAEHNKPPADQQNDFASDFRCSEKQGKTG